MLLKGSKTEQNLIAGFGGESMAANRYRFYAEKAKEEGYEQIGAIFEETADNEQEHAEMMFKYLNGIGKTEENLTAAAMGENEEWSEIYSSMEKTAREEGFNDIADFFKYLCDVEAEHEKRYNVLIDRVKEHTVFLDKEGNIYWKCRNCGYVHKGATPPEICPVCKHPKAYFERKAENY